MRSSGGAGNLLRAGSGHSEELADLSPRPVVVQPVGDARLALLHVRCEAGFEIPDCPVLLLIGLLVKRAEQGGVGGVQSLGHALRVGGIEPIDKQCLTAVAERPSVITNATSSAAWSGAVVHSYPAQPADGTTPKTGRNACDSYIAHAPTRHTTRFSERNP